MVVSKAVAQEVLALRSGRRGTLSSERVVAFASDPKTSLHSCFEWDDAVAGHKYRLKQAHEVIRSVLVEYKQEDNPANAVEAIAFVRDPAAGPRESRFAYLPKVNRPEAREVILSELKQIRGDLKRTVRIAKAKRDQLPRGVDGQVQKVLAAVQRIMDSI